MKTTKVSSRKLKFFKWVINSFIKHFDKDLRITKGVIWELEYQEAYVGFQEFKKQSNRGKSLSECLSKEEIKEYKTIILYKK